MNTLQKALIALSVGSLLSVSAQAAVNYAGQPYVGVKAGKFMVDADDLDDPTAYGIYAGYNFDPNFGIEAEYVGSGDADYYNGDIDAKSYGAYGTYRYQFPNTALYAKGKLGVAKTEIEGNYIVEDSNRKTISNDDTSLAGGVGLGYSVNPNFSVEAEYDMLGSDADLMTVGAQLKF